MPMAPPITVASEQKATTRQPLIMPTAASIPESSSAVISSTEPASSNAASRALGLRGSCSRGSLIFLGAAGAADSARALVPCEAGAVCGAMPRSAVVVISSLLWRRHW